MHNKKLRSNQLTYIKQKPLVIAIRALVAGGVTFGCGLSFAYADTHAPLPVGANMTALDGGKAVTTLQNNQTVNLNPVHGTATETLKNQTLVVNPSDNAIINWNSFDIDKGYTVDFQQNSAASVVLNNIGGQNASVIMGSLHANGQVFLFNQNGFIFEKGSEVNVNSLVATTLGISESSLQTGISKVFSNVAQANAGSAVANGAALKSDSKVYLQDSNGHLILDQSGNKIPVTLSHIDVKEGARIATNAAGGLVLLAASSIDNKGSISATSGQIILAAAKDKVYLQDSTDANVRGMVVEVGSGGEVGNSGDIIAKNGNVSMIGFAVNQNGIVSASTSVQLNGSVRLKAEEGIQNPAVTGGVLRGLSTQRNVALPDDLGLVAKVNLGAGSTTSVDLDDTPATALAAQNQPKSSIAISGHDVNVLNGAEVVAHSGNVDIKALDSLTNAAAKGNAHINIASGGIIDVSGVQVQESVSRNIVSLKLQSNELRDAPLQRHGVLYGKTVNVDIRDADISYDANSTLVSATVPIADIAQPYQNLASTVAERSTAGGKITLTSSGEVIVSGGSILDFSGGAVNYVGGDITTTALLSGNQIVDIGKAAANVVYTGIQNKTVYSPGYVQGAAGGELKISSYAAFLDGKLQGQTINGAMQRQATEWAPGSTLTIDLSDVTSSGHQDVMFSSANNGLNIEPAQSIPHTGASGNAIALNLNADMLSHSGVKTINIYTNGSATVASNARLSLSAGAEFNLNAENIDIEGSIAIPSGTINLQPQAIAGHAQASAIKLGAEALIDVSGLWVNDRYSIQHGQGLGLIDIDAGKVTMLAEQAKLEMVKGSRIDASAGAWLQSNGSVTAGEAGSISLKAVSHDGAAPVTGMKLEGSLSAWGLKQNGRLTLNSSQVVIGSAAEIPANKLSADALVLGSDFFKNGGFSSYDLISNMSGLTVTEGTQLYLQQHNLQLTSAAGLTATGAHLQGISQVVTLTDRLRNAVDLTLLYAELLTQNRDEALTIATGAKISTDPGGKVTLNSDTSIFEDGVISTPSGNIALNTIIPASDSGYFAKQGIWLGVNSQLLAKGIFVPDINANGLHTGTVKAGGQVDLAAKRGYIVTMSGSMIDVSGSSANVDSIQNASGGNLLVQQNISSAGGSINFKAGQGIIANGRFNARSGGGRSENGSLTVVLDRKLLDEPFPAVSGGKFPDQINSGLSSTLVVSSTTGNSEVAEGANIPLQYANQALLKTSLINTGGFGSIHLETDAQPVNGKLSSAIVFDGNMDIKASRQIVLDTPTLKTTTVDGQVTVEAPYVAIGSSHVNTVVQLNQNNLLAPDAVTGSGKFTVANAQGIDLIGGVGFNGYNQVNLMSSGGVRMIGDIDPVLKNDRGQMNIAGDLNIRAKQIYPSTLTSYIMNVSGSATFENQGAGADTLLSAGGSLTVNAANIYQKGRLEAPFGNISLNAAQTLELAANSVTSVSGKGSVVPFGVGAGGSHWLYPLNSSGANLVIDDSTLPKKALVLNGRTIDMEKGSTLDITGGGDLYAYEFIPGAGGSNDVLNTTQQFAVLPGINTILTPYDPQQYAASGLGGLGMGASVYLNQAVGLASGWYTLLPAHYALLPGAYLITPEAGTTGQTQTSYDTAGDPVVAGYFGVAGTSIQNPVTQGFKVQAGAIFTGSATLNSSGSTVINNDPASAAHYTSPAQYTGYSANAFFAAQAAKNGTVAPQLPQDAGSLLIAALSNLTLDATLKAEPGVKGLGGQVDITGDDLVVVGKAEDLNHLAGGKVGLLSSQLNNFNAPSLLLGGKRSHTAKGELLTITANTVSVDADVKDVVNDGVKLSSALTGQEILLAAIDRVDVASGANVIGTGKTSLAGGGLLLENSKGNSDGALLRVSSAAQINVNRDKAVSGNTGVLAVGAGAILKADGSMLLDSSQNTLFDGTIDMSKGALALNSSRISLGAAPFGTPGLVLASLPANLDELSFKSAGDFDIYGAFALNSKQVAISAASINGYANQGSHATITASRQIALTNEASQSNHAVVTGNTNGDLVLNAENIILGVGKYGITGFQNVTLNASQAVYAQSGTSSLNPAELTVDGAVVINAGHVSGGNAASATINAGKHQISLNPWSDKAPDSVDGSSHLLPTGLGVSWALSGSAIDMAGAGNQNARFDLPSGLLSLTANNGDVNIKNGSVIDLSGKQILFANTEKFSPAGNLQLTAHRGQTADKGNVNLATGSVINLSGFQKQLTSGVYQQASDAGTLAVLASEGRFNWDGSVNYFNNSPSIANNTTLSTGGLKLVVNSLGNDGFTGLNNKLQNAGFFTDNQHGKSVELESFSLQQHIGDLTINASDTLSAHHVELAIDQGSATVNGQINATATEAGSVSVYAENGIALGDNSAILAKAQGIGKEGGSVLLDTVHRHDSGSGLLDLSASGAVIDVSAGSNGKGGSVHLRTGRDDATNQLSITAVNTRIRGAAAQSESLEAVRVYTDINANTSNVNTITADNINSWQLDTANFMQARPVALDNSGNSLNLASGVELLPGIEIRSSSDLKLAASWDFEAGGSGWSNSTSTWNSGWRYGDANLPGFLTLRAAGDLNVNASISDGLAITPIPGTVQIQDPEQPPAPVFQNIIQPGRSWSYSLIAGGNVNLAASYAGQDPLGSGNLVDTQVAVRTGTGDIKIAAGKDIVLNRNSQNSNTSNNASAVYTIGTTALYTLSELLAGEVPGLPAQQSDESLQHYLSRLDPDKLNEMLRYGLLDANQLGLNYLYAEYPVNGGDISLTAGANIQGQQTGQPMTDWLVRSGYWVPTDTRTHSTPTAWGINISGNWYFNSITTGVLADGVTAVYGQDNRNFNQNIGALGGGDVTIRAGKNINQLSVMLPSSGKPLGIMSGPDVWVQNGTVVNGGGNLDVKAGQDIVGGEFYVSSGTGRLIADGAISQSGIPNSDLTVGAVLELGQGSFDLQARGDIQLATVMNPTLIAQSTPFPDPALFQDTRFFTYGADSAVNLQSTAGNVVFLNNTKAVVALDNLPGSSRDSGMEYTIYPAKVSAAALSGDIRINNAMTLYPSVNGALSLLANSNIGRDAFSGAGQNIILNMPDTDPANLPGINNPASDLESANGDIVLTRELLNPRSTLPLTIHAAIPLHLNAATKPLIVASHGNIDFTVADQASFYLSQAADIIAGGNISNLSISTQNLSGNDVTRIQAGGNLLFDAAVDGNGNISPNDQFIQVSGPGQLQVLTGGSVNLGSSKGIETLGNLYNPAISATGAGIQILAGASDTIDYAGFINKYQAHPVYSSQLQGLANLTPEQQRMKLDKLLNVLFLEISKSARLAAGAPENQRFALYQIGYDAIHALFPGSNYSGDLNLVFSEIKTLAGGDINLLTPGGKVDVGLAGKLGGISKGASDLGIVVQGDGKLNIFSQGDVNVNQSRVFTLGDGDITVWSSTVGQGGIDAGKGARSAISAPPPVTVVKPQGQTETTFPPIISGSGIQAIGGGSVYLAAPSGVVNAGEAGISGKDIVVAATAVVGASNITSTGNTVGVSSAVTTPVVAGADAAATGASKAANQSATEDKNAEREGGDTRQKTTISILTTDVVGFGSCSVGDVKEAKAGCGG